MTRHRDVVIDGLGTAGDAAEFANPMVGARHPATCHSGQMTGNPMDGFRKELDSLLGESLVRAMKRCQTLPVRFNAGRPSADNLRRRCIDYMAFWPDPTTRHGEYRDELLEA